MVGTGVIGSAWAAIFHAKGYVVTAYVRSISSQQKFERFLQAAWQKLLARGLATKPDGWRGVTCVSSVAECVASADYVQESVVEDLGTKLAIIAEIDAHAPAEVLIGSSSSFIPLSLVRSQAARHPGRVCTTAPVMHPVAR